MRIIAAMTFLLFSGVASAAVVNKVFKPTVEYGEKEIELRGFFTQDADPLKDNAQVNKFDIAWGATQWWFTELEFVWEKEPGGSNELAAIASENVFQLSEQGQYFADFGFFFEYEREWKAKVHEIVLGPIVQKQFGQWLGTINVFFERKFGPEVVEREIETKTAAQLKYRLSPFFEPGIEYYGEEEDMNLGPAAFGQVKLGSTKLKWQAAWLFGLTDVAADNSIRWMLEYEF